MRGARWQVADGAVPEELSRDYPGLMARILANRGVTTSAEAELFLAGDARLAGDPMLLPDIQPAMTRVYRAILGNEPIVVYGDYDTDGITATAIMVTAIKRLGGQVTPYIPHRLNEGYGLKHEALKQMADDGVRLVVTVDCGISAVDEITAAARLKLDVIVTDHHLPGHCLPPAVAVINPHRTDSAYPFPELSGAGVAFKVAEALFQGMGKPMPADHYLELAALGTVADIMPLTGENRYLVKEGLKHLNDHPSPGLTGIITRANLKPGNLEAETISWQVAPRLNAAGRLNHAIAGYRLLMAADPTEAAALADELEDQNQERQRLTSFYVNKARDQVNSAGQLPPLLFIEDSECPQGILGLVAGRLADEFFRPSIVVRSDDTQAVASCRSIPGFNITEAIDRCGDLLSHYGGHAQAAGFSLEPANLKELASRLHEITARELLTLDLQPMLIIDAEARLRELGGGLFRMIQRLAPFGEGNRSPLFVSRCVTAVHHRPIGASGDHLKMRLTQGGVIWEAIAFRQAAGLLEILPDPVDIVYNLEMDRFNGRETLRLNIVDFAPSV